MQDEIDDKYADYLYLYNKEWCELLSALKAKDSRKR